MERLKLRPPHQKAIEKTVERFREDARFLALIVGGSIVKDRAEENSDVDIMLVATDEEFEKRKPGWDLHYYAEDLCDYPGGYVDGKIVDLQFLRDVADFGSEPARAAFVGAFIAYSRVPELAGILQRILVYPEDMQKEKIKSFYAQVEAYRWYLREAEKRNDRYLLTHAVSNLVLFGGRMLFAHNRVLYPFHKWFMYELRDLPEKPEKLIVLIEALLEHPCQENAERFCETLLNFTEWDKPAESWPARFVVDREWGWRNGNISLEDW